VVQPKARGKVAIPEDLLHELHVAGRAAEYGLSAFDFAEVLGCIVTKFVPTIAADGLECEEFLRGLRVEELALAHGCAAGHEHAWTVFLNRFREKLYDAGRAIAKGEDTGRELADSLYADLYGTTERDGVRISKLASYSGRGSLEGWLRSVLAQEWVNRYRKGKRLVSLEEEEQDGIQFAAEQSEQPPPVHEQVIAASDSALAALEAEERYILASYFLDQRTLAEIARTLGVHESTISRKLERAAGRLRKQIMDSLLRAGMSRRQAEEAMEFDVRDLAIDVRSRLSQRAPASLSRARLQDVEKDSF
jgi:RNA polymerase sigma-70 factor (ECF subfamily)